MSRRRALLGAFAAVIVALAIWLFAGRERSHAPPASTPATHDEAFAQRLRAIREASAARPPTLPRYQIRGRVIDGAGTPVPDAAVVLGAHATRSGTNGEFTLAGLLPGRYAIEARKGPLVGGPLAVQLSADREVTLVVRRGAVLRVEVVSAQDKHPIANADVRISLLSMYDHGGEQQARTDANGVASFEGVTLVAHTVWVGADGFADRDDTVDPMTVVDTTLTFRIELTPGVTVRGRVIDAETRQPIAGATLEGVRGDHREPPRRGADHERYGNTPPYVMEVRGIGARSDAEGRFRIGVTKGPWTVVAAHPSYATIGSFVSVSDAPPEVEIAMTKGIVLHGMVVTEHDVPVPGAEVEARWQHGGRVERTVQADGRGQFELVGLPAAPLEFVARAAEATGTPKRFDLSQTIPEEDVLLVLDNTGVITGHVMRMGAPVAAAQVFYVEQNARTKVHPSVVNADASGAFRIAGVALDRSYSLTAMPHQDGDAWFRSGGGEAKAGADVTIEIPADGNVRGRVEVAGGKVALSDVRVEIEGNTPPRALEHNGGFAFERIPPGSRTLKLTGALVAERRVVTELKAGQDLDLGVIQLAAGRVVAGKVVGAKQEPVVEADVIMRAEGSSELRTMTAHDGAFSLVAPADRELAIEVYGRRGGVIRTTVPAKGPSSELVLRLAGTATLEGAITAGDEPITGASVTLRDATTTDRPYAYSETDASGYFKLQSLQPGSYQLTITRMDSNTGMPVKYGQAVDIKTGANYANTDVSKLQPQQAPGAPSH